MNGIPFRAVASQNRPAIPAALGCAAGQVRKAADDLMCETPYFYRGIQQVGKNSGFHVPALDANGVRADIDRRYHAAETVPNGYRNGSQTQFQLLFNQRIASFSNLFYFAFEFLPIDDGSRCAPSQGCAF